MEPTMEEFSAQLNRHAKASILTYNATKTPHTPKESETNYASINQSNEQKSKPQKSLTNVNSSALNIEGHFSHNTWRKEKTNT